MTQSNDLTRSELVKKIVEEMEQKYQIGVSQGGALLVDGVTTRTTDFRTLAGPILCSDEFERRSVYALARKELILRHTRDRSARKPKWDFFECFSINRLGVPCHNGVPFKPFLKYIKAIVRAHGANLDDMEILKIKMEIDQRLESDV